jgi:membrane-associated protease RseP (regulator of RpoE activity)
MRRAVKLTSTDSRESIFVGDSEMSKLMQSIAVAGVGLLAATALLRAGSPQSGSSAPASASPAVPAPVVVAMQEPGAQTPAKPAVPDQGWIGLMLDDSKGQGARVVDVFPAGPAAFAGLRVGDVVTRVGETAVTSHESAAAAIERLAPRQPVSVTVDRNGRSVELKVTVDSLNDFRQRYVNEMLHRDPRHPHYGTHPGVSDSDMSAEVVRRLFEQHERQERALHEVLKELRELRQEVRALKK